jgi:uncharacterized membrane protein
VANESLRIARWVFAALLAAVVLQALVYYPRLPERMASHFNGAGQAIGWSSKARFFGLHTFVVAVVTACFAILPAWIQRLPARLINLPNKDYWLAPERQGATMAGVSAALTWFGCAVLIFILALTRLVIRVNLGRDPVLSAPALWACMGGLVLCLALMILRMLYLGRRPPG